jgi:Rrf2 family transcriptional regulator, nitric oxide-sensitive transcriptional repressor
MRLTLQTDYALRVLMFVAAKGEAPATIGEVAGRFAISRGHLMKVVHRLGRQGYLDTIRGKKGGMRLARRPDQINVGAVVRDMEEELAVLGCLRPAAGYCRIEGCCVLRGALREATDAFLATLDRYTLDDLLAPGPALAQLLGLGDRAAGPDVASFGP